MAELLGTYDPAQVVCIVAGVILSGFSEGDIVTAKRDEDLFSKKVGVDGGVSRARIANKSGSFEFKLAQTSNSNDQLSALLAIDNLVNDGLAVVPISVVDGSGRSLAVATQCWLKTQPDLAFGKETGERVWVFDAADLKIFHGGGN